MKYTASYDGQDRVSLAIPNLRFTKKEIEKVRRFLKKNGKRGLDIDIRRFVFENAVGYVIVNRRKL